MKIKVIRSPIAKKEENVLDTNLGTSSYNFYWECFLVNENAKQSIKMVYHIVVNQHGTRVIIDRKILTEVRVASAFKASPLIAEIRS